MVAILCKNMLTFPFEGKNHYYLSDFFSANLNPPQDNHEEDCAHQVINLMEKVPYVLTSLRNPLDNGQYPNNNFNY